MPVDTIREAMRRQPFVPFKLRMNDGREYLVPHPDYLAVAHRHVYFVDPTTETGIFLDIVLIASLEPQAVPARG
jgi:hypothetical protein